MRRKSTNTEVETAVLAKSARRCALCFHLNGDLREKLGQIAHLDRNPTNSAEDNLAFMCLPHHSLFDSSTSQHKNYTVSEVKGARNRLHELVSSGKHIASDVAIPNSNNDADKKVFNNLMKALPSNGSIKFIRETNFGFAFEWSRLNDISAFLHEYGGPDHEFLNSELESVRSNFRTECDKLMNVLAMNTWPTKNSDWQAVPWEWEEKDPKRFNRVLGEMHTTAASVCAAYDELVRLARRTIKV